jgi:hypothetical protein
MHPAVPFPQGEGRGLTVRRHVSRFQCKQVGRVIGTLNERAPEIGGKDHAPGAAKSLASVARIGGNLGRNRLHISHRRGRNANYYLDIPTIDQHASQADC